MYEWTETSAADFMHNYQKTSFMGNVNRFAKCNTKRQCIHQVFNGSQKFSSNETTCHILQTKLDEYSAEVDKSDGVNNYACGVLDLNSNSPCDSQNWRSQASASELLQEIKGSIGECCNKGAQGCMAQKPLHRQINTFLETEKNFASIKKKGNDYIGKPTHIQPIEEVTSRSASSHTSNPSPQWILEKSSEGSKVRPDTGAIQTIARKVFRPDQSNSISQIKPQYTPSFRTAGTELKLQSSKKNGHQTSDIAATASYGANKKSLGGRTRSVNSKFVAPIKSDSQQDEQDEGREDLEDERLRLIDPKMVDLIRSEIMDHGPPVHWDHIAGLTFAKATIQEIVVLPMLRPDIFTGLRRPPKGILFFGPPGTGKTLIGKCVASQSKSTFFNISASSLTSKWVGEGEKMVRTLFTLARVHQPAVVFIDEIDSLLSQRSDTEHESSRRIKTEFLVQLDGAGTGEEDRILVIGATNRPQELDEAARRRLVKRLYIPLPDHPARSQMVQTLMSSERHVLSLAEVEEVAALTDGYSGADMKTLCQEACLGPIRALSFSDIEHINPDQVRPVTIDDFRSALQRVRSSVSPKDLETYVMWNETYGSGSAK